MPLRLVNLKEIVQGVMNGNPLGLQSRVFDSTLKKKKTVTPDPQICLSFAPVD